MTAEQLSDDLQTRPIRRSEYELLAVQGFFADEHVELLDGRIVVAEEEGPPHAAVVRRLTRILVEAVPASEAEVGVGNPVGLSDLSSPQPDLMLIPPATTYRAAHPTTASLVIEVAHSSRRKDLGLKAVLYAAAGIPDYWVVDLTRDEVVVHRDPAGPSFASVRRHREGRIQALRHPAVVVDVPALLR
jgi:Uma2 family endonuclease